MELVLKESPKKPVNKVIAWVCSLCYLLLGGLILYFVLNGGLLRLFNIFNNGFNFSILNLTDKVLLVFIILVIGFLVFCLNFFEWIFNPVLKEGNGTLVFKTDDVIAAMNKVTTTYTIEYISSYKVRRNKIEIRGFIIVKEPPLLKAKERKYCEIVCLYDKEDKEKAIQMVKEFMKDE